MAAHMIAINGKEYAADGSYAEQPGEGAARPKRLLYSYFTAGECTVLGWLEVGACPARLDSDGWH